VHGDFIQFSKQIAMSGYVFKLLAGKGKRSDDWCHIQRIKEPSPMWIHESERCVHWNWVAIFSYTASLAVSLAI
jgi:hypothetical protein